MNVSAYKRYKKIVWESYHIVLNQWSRHEKKDGQFDFEECKQAFIKYKKVEQDLLDEIEVNEIADFKIDKYIDGIIKHIDSAIWAGRPGKKVYPEYMGSIAFKMRIRVPEWEGFNDLPKITALEIAAIFHDQLQEFKRSLIAMKDPQKNLGKVKNSSSLLKEDAVAHIEIIENNPEIARMKEAWKNNLEGRKTECAAFCEFLFNRGYFLDKHKRRKNEACKELALERYGFDVGATTKAKYKEAREDKIDEIQRCLTGIRYGIIPKK